MDDVIVMEMLKKLKELLDMGAITQEEFDRKGKEFMRQILPNSDNKNNKLQPLRQNQHQIQILKNINNAMKMLKELKESLDIRKITQEKFNGKKAELMSQISFNESG